MDTACLADIHSEAQSALDAGSFDMLVIVYANTAVQKVETYYPGDTIADGPEHGTGGTSFAQPLDYVAAEYPDASALVYLTDGGTSDWGTDPGCPVLWALTIPAQYARSIVPPFGDSVPML
jgi:predicted metal-dependent peptidase